ncbi:CHAT domain-containing protein [Planktomarina temperata]|nr:CHAT domain-containing protein [Planktomarina temperata]
MKFEKYYAFFSFITLVFIFSIFSASSSKATETNPWNTFYTGNITGAIHETLSLMETSSNISDKISMALALLEFCNYSRDVNCQEPAFKVLNDTSDTASVDDQTKRWIETELQNALVANAMQYPEIRQVFRDTRFEHINYFSYGDGTISNFLNAQAALALAAREEHEPVYSREVVTRLIYLLTKLPSEESYTSLRGQVLAKIISISIQIGDLYTARHFFNIADEYIINNIYYLKPYLYQYLYNTSQLLASSENAEDQRTAIKRILMAKSILSDGFFDEDLKRTELSMLHTTQIFVALKLRDWAQARYLYLTHPLYVTDRKLPITEVQQGHELYFFGTGFLLKDSGLLEEIDLPETDVRIFSRKYSWERLEVTGAVLKFTKLIGLYLHKKSISGILEPSILEEAFEVLLDQIQRDLGPTSTLNTQPSFYFQPLADYYLLEASRQKFNVDVINLVKVIDSLNRKPAQIYGDFLASAPRKGTSDYFIAHTLFDLSSNRLSAEASILSDVISNVEASSRQTDSLVKINVSIQSLSERAEIEWQKKLGVNYIETDIQSGNALLFGYEMGGYINIYCANGKDVYHSGGYPLSELKTAAKKLKGALTTTNAFLVTWQDFPFDAAAKLGGLIYNSNFSECFHTGAKLTFVPFGPLSDIPLGILLNKKYDGAFKTAPWAITQNSFTYASSIKEAFNAYFDDHAVAANTFLGVSNPVFDPNAQELRITSIDTTSQNLTFGTRSFGLGNFVPLPETEKEIKTISELFENPKLLSAVEATERNLRGSHLARFDVLSFATHGALSNEAEGLLDPSLILTQEHKKTTGYLSNFTDGIFTADEISKLNLNASIVSLSACNTATTDLSSSSKNVQSLASAFRLAGVDNVVATLWSVESQAAAQLNIEMFQIWTSAQTTIANSLQRAQLNYLVTADETKASPAFWGPIVIIGSGQSIADKDQKLGEQVALEIYDETGYVSGIAAGADNTLLISKNIELNSGRLSPSVERTSSDKQELNTELTSDDVYGSVIMHEALGRNLMSSISYEENQIGQYKYSPMISEYDEVGNLLWNYQYPLKSKTFTNLYSLTSLPNGNVFALLHSDFEDGSDYGLTSLSGLILSPQGEFIAENIYYSSPEPLPLNRSLAITPAASSAYFGVVLNISKYGHTGRIQGDLGEVFSCSEPEALIYLISYENYNIFASDKIENFWVDSAFDNGDGIYFSGAMSDQCRFNLVMGGIPAFGFYKDMEFSILHEDPSFVPSKITDLYASDYGINYTQIWRPKVGGMKSKNQKEISESLDELWDYSERSETEDSVYSFVGVGKWKSKDDFDLNFLPLNNFWAEGGKIKGDKAIFYGRLGAKPSIASTALE